MSAPCTHRMPTPASCIDCMDEGNIPTPPRPERPTPEGPAIHAKFPGDCPSCGLAIHNGQRIQRWSDERWRHEGCEP